MEKFAGVVAAVEIGGFACIDEAGGTNTQALSTEQTTRKARRTIGAFFTKLSTDIDSFVAGAQGGKAVVAIFFTRRTNAGI